MSIVRSLPLVTLGLIILPTGKPLLAQEAVLEASAAASAAPSGGLTMDQVRRGFGDPKQTIPAVGQPPITRWVYADYVVYFEYQYVIHSVRTSMDSMRDAAIGGVPSVASAK